MRNLNLSNLFLPILLIYFLFIQNKKVDDANHDALFDIPNGNNSNTNNNSNNNTNNGNVYNDVNAPTISAIKAESLAEQLYDIMYWAFSSNDDILEILIEIQTEPNYKLVSQKFGFKNFDESWGGLNPWGTKMNLTQWINKELDSTEERQTLKSMFPNIF